MNAGPYVSFILEEDRHKTMPRSKLLGYPGRLESFSNEVANRSGNVIQSDVIFVFGALSLIQPVWSNKEMNDFCEKYIVKASYGFSAEQILEFALYHAKQGYVGAELIDMLDEINIHTYTEHDARDFKNSPR